MQIACEQATADREFTELAEAYDGIHRQRLERLAEDHEGEGDEAQESEERVRAREAERVVRGGEIGIRLDDLTVREHSEKGQDRGDARHIDEPHHEDHCQQQHEAPPLAGVE